MAPAPVYHRATPTASQLNGKPFDGPNIGLGFGIGKAATALRRRVRPAGSWCSLPVRKDLRMNGGARTTEDTVDDRGLSPGGFSKHEPSNQPLQRTVGCAARR